MNNVFVIDTNKQPLNPVHPGRARMLLSQGKAAVFKYYPFTIVLTYAVEQPCVAPLRIKIDPGSKTSGIALVNDVSGEVVFAAELTHRGEQIKKRLDRRRAVRRSRRQRKTRYRKPRFDNRKRRDGRLAPSMESRISNILTWVKRLKQLCSITAISQELVSFDTQAMEHAEISGVEYQQGTLLGFEVREYLLAKWERTCAYCGASGVPLQIEHICPRAQNGSNRVCNLTLACASCNEAKGTQDVYTFLSHKPDVLAKILAQAKKPLKDAAAVNSTRWVLYHRLTALGMPVECGSGGLTKYNRTQRGLPKMHWVDAACVGKSTPEHLSIKSGTLLLIKANGHGSRQMCGVSTCGFPLRHRTRQVIHYGYRTGDMVRARVPKGKKQGEYVGRVLVRASGSFDLQTKQGRVQGIGHRYCTPVHRNDGYSYTKGGGHSFPA